MANRMPVDAPPPLRMLFIESDNPFSPLSEAMQSTLASCPTVHESHEVRCTSRLPHEGNRCAPRHTKRIQVSPRHALRGAAEINAVFIGQSRSQYPNTDGDPPEKTHMPHPRRLASACQLSGGFDPHRSEVSLSASPRMAFLCRASASKNSDPIREVQSSLHLDIYSSKVLHRCLFTPPPLLSPLLAYR